MQFKLWRHKIETYRCDAVLLKCSQEYISCALVDNDYAYLTCKQCACVRVQMTSIYVAIYMCAHIYCSIDGNNENNK